MAGQLEGIHHVTAVTGKASANVAFYTKVLGMRLVKKTVNQDVTSSYHLFYADKVGTAGTDMTFFDWPAVPRHRQGHGDVAATAFMVPRNSLPWWLNRLAEHRIAGDIVERNGRSLIPFTDPEGQRLELIEGGESRATPWERSPVPAGKAIRGLAAVTLTVAALEPTSSVLTKLLGFRRAGEYAFPDNSPGSAVVFDTGSGGLGAEVHVESRPDLPAAEVGIGGVHHVAFRTPDDPGIRAWRETIAGAGIAVTGVIDRYYFRSIYFREPGGVLFEIATDGPGFAQDEELEHLGESLSLPPFLESRRSEIEAQLAPL